MRIDLARRPVFVIGTGRCGTTLLTDLIQGERISCLKERQVQSRFPQFGNGHIFNLVDRGDIPEEVFLALFRTTRAALLQRHDPSHVYCEKIPHGQWAIERMRRVFPAAKFIEIHREGKDTVQSMIHAGWYAKDDPRPRWAPRGPRRGWDARPQFEKCCVRYAHTIAHTIFNRMTMAPEDYLSFSYEELMENPEAISTRIEAFTGETLFRGRVALKPSRENWRTWSAAQYETYDAILGDEGRRGQVLLGYEAWSMSSSS